jgi:pectin methylesterase-like acyl-CoA thioesterase
MVEKIIKKSFVLIICIILANNIVIYSNNRTVEANSNTIYVDDDGGADFSNIQDAIDASLDGDTIYVKNGYYPIDRLFINKTINLVGENSENTIISAQNNDGAVVFSLFSPTRLIVLFMNNLSIG